MPDAPPAPPRFVTGSTMRHVVVMASTGAIGLIAVFSVDLLNLFYISLLGQRPIAAAVGFAGVVGFLQTSVAIGLMIGISAVVSRTIGAGRMADARRIASGSLAVMTALMLALGLAHRRGAGPAADPARRGRPDAGDGGGVPAHHLARAAADRGGDVHDRPVARGRRCAALDERDAGRGVRDRGRRPGADLRAAPRPHRGRDQHRDLALRAAGDGVAGRGAPARPARADRARETARRSAARWPRSPARPC